MVGNVVAAVVAMAMEAEAAVATEAAAAAVESPPPRSGTLEVTEEEATAEAGGDGQPLVFV